MTAFVGAMAGAERSVLPVVVREELGSTVAAAVAFIAAFGAAKAFANLAAGRLADRAGRARTLRLGWLLAVPTPFAVASATSAADLIWANLLLGASQGLVWSMALLMTLDIAGPRRRGLGSAVNESAGYVATGIAAYAAAILSGLADPRSGPAVVSGVALAAGLLCSLAVRDTRPLVWREPATDAGESATRRSRIAVAQAGFMNNANDAFAWGVLPLVAAARGGDAASIGGAAGIYAGAWGVVQLAAGPASDRFGRRGLVVAGMLVQACGMAAYAAGLPAAPAALAWGTGTGLVYPTLIAAAADGVPARERPRALATYRFWRDGGLAVGALTGGAVATAYGLDAGLWFGAAATFSSAVIALFIES